MRKKLKHPLTFYIPKSESADEGCGGVTCFAPFSRAKGWAPDYIKCMALVESHPLAYEMEEFAYNLREHLLAFESRPLGLHGEPYSFQPGPIRIGSTGPEYDPSTWHSFRICVRKCPKICHKHGLLAIGGMTAL